MPERLEDDNDNPVGDADNVIFDDNQLVSFSGPSNQKKWYMNRQTRKKATHENSGEQLLCGAGIFRPIVTPFVF